MNNCILVLERDSDKMEVHVGLNDNIIKLTNVNTRKLITKQNRTKIEVNTKIIMNNKLYTFMGYQCNGENGGLLNRPPLTIMTRGTIIPHSRSSALSRSRPIEQSQSQRHKTPPSSRNMSPNRSPFKFTRNNSLSPRRLNKTNN